MTSTATHRVEFYGSKGWEVSLETEDWAVALGHLDALTREGYRARLEVTPPWEMLSSEEQLRELDRRKAEPEEEAVVITDPEAVARLSAVLEEHGVKTEPRQWARRYSIREREVLLTPGAPDAPELAVIAADSETEALALYSMSKGFADPRQYIGEPEDFFYTMPDGTVGMVFTNTELYAVEVEPAEPADYVNHEAVQAMSTEELGRAVREDSMPAAAHDAMVAELERRRS